MKAFSVLFHLLAAGCGSVGPVAPENGVDPELQPYVDSFYRDIHISLPQVFRLPVDSVTFSEDFQGKHSVIASCRTHIDFTLRGADPGQVTISRVAWDVMTEGSRLNVVYHELAHCVLFAHHDGTYQGSMMSTHMRLDLSEEEFREHWSRFVFSFQP